MRKLLSMGLGVLLLLSYPSQSIAVDTGVFDITAEIPSATKIAFVVYRVEEGQPWENLGEGSQTLAYQLEYDSPTGKWLPLKYYIIDIASRDALNNPAVGTPNLQVSYTDTNNPNNNNSPGGGTGLEAKGIITVVNVVGAPGSQTENEVYKNTFSTITTSRPFSKTSFPLGFPRFYLAISDGVGTGEAFTNSDTPGSYEGTITITATLN